MALEVLLLVFQSPLYKGWYKLDRSSSLEDSAQILNKVSFNQITFQVIELQIVAGLSIAFHKEVQEDSISPLLPKCCPFIELNGIIHDFRVIDGSH